ncbi:Rne/Rng family ribonuclease [Specibacter sp. NPDC057265]|uniref:Rne/Rng family ribonuclease n=1 Tax=Specibacter sp. NPDC057265 TaxID=3346075 RepID=UPI003633F04C
MINEQSASNAAHHGDDGAQAPDAGTANAAAPAKAKTTRPRRASSAATQPADGTEGLSAAVDGAAESAPVKKAPVRRSRAKKATPATDAAGTAAPADSAIDPAPPLPEGTDPSATAAEAGNGSAAKAKRPVRRRATAPVMAPAAAQEELPRNSVDTAVPTTSAASTGTAPAAGEAAEGAGQAPAKAPARRRRAAKAPAGKPLAESAAVPRISAEPTELEVPELEVPEKQAQQMPADAGEPVDAPAPAKAPARRASRRAVAPAAAVSTPEAAAADPESAADPADAAASTGTGRNVRSRRRSSAATGAPQAAAPAPEEAAAAVVDAGVDSEATPAAPMAEPDRSPSASAAGGTLFQEPATGMSALFLAPDLSLSTPVVVARDTISGAGEDNKGEAGEDGDGDRRSRRGRNRRNRGGESTESAEPAESGEDAEFGTEAAEEGVSSRRRRRRRRGDADLELSGGNDDDPPNTVTRVRAPRAAVEAAPSNRVTSLRGSTRLEAKKQRRRDSRDSGRRRTVITEAEFLARRESVDRVMVVRQSEDRIQIGVLEDGILAEHFVSKTQQDSLIGNVYVGKVQNVLPSMEAAFVDIGRGRNAVLYAGEVDWDAADLKGQPRRIENALKSGDSVLVQVSKDPVGHKGARLTSQISLPGRYLVFVPGGSMTGISRKLPDVERNRLKRVLKDHLPENAGVIVRTAAEGASEEELTNDINRLRAQWEGINNRAASAKTLAPEMLYAEPDLTIKVVRDVFNEDFTKLIVSGEEAWDTIEAYVTYVAPDLLDRLEKWSSEEDIFSAHRIDEQINKALERKVFLPSGGSLVIDRTEAMTVVDVNTGKFTGSGGNLEETVTKNNLEAAEEVVRQLRLRDIGGIIVIDFIDMVLESNRDLVLRRLVECLGRDRTKHQVAEVTSLGLVQMTRKRMGTGLLEVFGEQCPSCAGRGMVTHEIPVEHRRNHAASVEVVSAPSQAPKHEPREQERTANRSTRSERKRNRNRSQQAELEAGHDVPAAPAVDAAADAAKVQKAQEARIALAAIAAAAAAAHHEPAAAGQVGAAIATTPAAASDGATLTLGGEAVELPRGHRGESRELAESTPVDKAAALAGLAQALDQLAAPSVQEGATSGVEAVAGEKQAVSVPGDAGDGGRARSRRPRRNRSARSAQGGADTAVETVDSVQHGQGSAPHSSAAAVVPAAAPVAVKSAEPIILGVGVPASEL